MVLRRETFQDAVKIDRWWLRRRSADGAGVDLMQRLWQHRIEWLYS
jgi:hypothetical protein